MTLNRVFFVLSLLFFSSVAFSEEAQSERSKMQEAADEVENDINYVVRVGGEYAFQRLVKQGGMEPFGVGLNKEGTTVLFDVPKEKNKGASMADKVLELRSLLAGAAQSGNLDCAALFVDSRVPVRGEDRIQPGLAIEMEHKSGMSILRFSPYELDSKKEDLEFQAPIDKVKPVAFFGKDEEQSKGGA